jgi:hypothetical protein
MTINAMQTFILLITGFLPAANLHAESLNSPKQEAHLVRSSQRTVAESILAL